MFPRLFNPDGSGATFAASSGGRSSTKTVLILGPVSCAADPMRSICTGGLMLEKSMEARSKSSLKSPFHNPVFKGI